MSCEISEALKRLAAEYEHATTQKVRDRLTREIASVSYKQERDREGAHRRDTDKGRFEASMLSFDEHMAKFDDPSKVATFSDGGKGAEDVRNGGVELPEDMLEEALGQLSERDKAFVCDVLNGNGWAELGMPKATFYRRLKKVEEAVRLTPLKSLALRHEGTCGRRRLGEPSRRPVPNPSGH